MNYKKIVFFSTLFASSISFSQVAIGNIDPNPHAQLDVSGEKKGVLIPQITLSDITKVDPFDDTVDRIPESLLVYNVGPDVVAGYYYWSGTKWNKIAVQSDPDTGLTTNILESFENTMTSKVNDVEATAPIINTVTNALDVATIAGYPLTTIVNGIEAITVNIPEPWNLAGGSIKATKNDENIYMNGKVGIGDFSDNNPSAWLDVKGDALINGLTIGKGNGDINNNTAVGISALASNTTGNQNTANGSSALLNNTEGNRNTANGYLALRSNTKGNNNIANGYYTLYRNTEGNNNTANGVNTLEYNITGNYNTAIGSYSGPLPGYNDLSNTTAIGYNAKVTASHTIQLGNTDIEDVYTSGNLHAKEFFSTSDRRYKENIKTIPLGLDFINKIRPVEYSRKNNEKKTKEWGVIAQELQQTLDQMGYLNYGIVKQDNTPDKYLSVAYTELIAPLIKAVQELSLQNEELKRENDQKISALENEINEMKKRIH